MKFTSNWTKANLKDQDDFDLSNVNVNAVIRSALTSGYLESVGWDLLDSSGDNPKLKIPENKLEDFTTLLDPFSKSDNTKKVKEKILIDSSKKAQDLLDFLQGPPPGEECHNLTMYRIKTLSVASLSRKIDSEARAKALRKLNEKAKLDMICDRLVCAPKNEKDKVE